MKEYRCNKCNGVIIKKSIAIKWFGIKDAIAYTHSYCMGKPKLKK